jgi:hypothetical protein
MTLIPDLERHLEAAAAGRMRSVRRRAWQVAAVGVAAVIALAVAVTVLSSSDEGPGATRAADDGQRPDTPAPPQGTPRPAPGTLVTLSTFDFRGVRYRVSGYLSRAHGSLRNDSVCVQIKRTPPVAPGSDRPSVTCAGDGLLRRGLRRQRVLYVGASGGPPGRREVTGFTVTGVSRIRAVGTNWPAHVELTRPWRPLAGEPIRAFVIVADPPRDAKQPRNAFKIHAVEAGG